MARQIRQDAEDHHRWPMPLPLNHSPPFLFVRERLIEATCGFLVAGRPITSFSIDHRRSMLDDVVIEQVMAWLGDRPPVAPVVWIDPQTGSQTSANVTWDWLRRRGADNQCYAVRLERQRHHRVEQASASARANRNRSASARTAVSLAEAASSWSRKPTRR